MRTDKGLAPEVLCHHSLNKSRVSGSTPAAAHPQGCAGERPGVSKAVLMTREAHRVILIERDARGTDGHCGWRVLPGPQGDNPVELLATTGGHEHARFFPRKVVRYECLVTVVKYLISLMHSSAVRLGLPTNELIQITPFHPVEALAEVHLVEIKLENAVFRVGAFDLHGRDDLGIFRRNVRARENRLTRASWWVIVLPPCARRPLRTSATKAPPIQMRSKPRWS